MASLDTPALRSKINPANVLMDVDSVMAESAFPPTPPVPSLEEAAAEIEKLAAAENDLTLLNAINAASLKRRIIAGEAGPDVKWMAWMRKHVKISQSQLYALVKIGSAKDPVAALEDYRRKNREKSKKKFEPDNLSENHRLLIRLVKKLGDNEAKAEYLRMFQRYPNLI